MKNTTGIKDELKKTLNTKGWDGRWFKRAINDDGNEIGSINNTECRIDGLVQSWAVISNAGDNDKKYISMDEAEHYLVDRENKIIKLFDPPFEKSEINPGYIKAYPAGIRENGGQYTHEYCCYVQFLHRLTNNCVLALLLLIQKHVNVQIVRLHVI